MNKMQKKQLYNMRSEQYLRTQFELKTTEHTGYTIPTTNKLFLPMEKMIILKTETSNVHVPSMRGNFPAPIISGLNPRSKI